MKNIIIRNIELLNEKVDSTTMAIGENSKVIKEILNTPFSNHRTKQVIYHFRQSNDLYGKNRMLMNLRYELIRTLNSNDDYKTFGTMSLS